MHTVEKLKPNQVNAPTLFIGLGGIGSKIIKGVADRAANDRTENMRFVVMDTDANDLLSANQNAKIYAIQTSSTRSVENYLENDKDAKNNWFPENRMLDVKNVSEGAGQVRAISRLALNDVIKSGRILALYKAIDDLFLKDGGGFKQAIRVIIASTATGGTGSGISIAMGMLIRHYINKNYPESAVMIRGYLVLPGVMDTVITSQSERDSQRCNGYAAIKEINAFMMKGSGFFDTVPELQRYQDLSITVPTPSGGSENISTLPFNFCFLMDRTDSNTGNMMTLSQYISYSSQTIYEQTIGSLQTKSASVEDNILKLCMDPVKLGRCRFAGAGAAILRYPYEDIRDYIALNWARAAIIGSSADDKLSEKDRDAILKSSWLQYDERFKLEHKLWDENPSSSSANEPTRAGVYISSIEAGRESGNGNDFTIMLWDKYLKAKIAMLGDSSEERTTAGVACAYIRAFIDGVINGPIENEFALKGNNLVSAAGSDAPDDGFVSRYSAIANIERIAQSKAFENIVRSFVKEVLSSKSAVGKEDLGEYMLERFLSVNGRIMHPNAARYMLYKLQIEIEKGAVAAATDISSFERNKENYTVAKDDDKRFDVVLSLGKEKTLYAMCEAVDGNRMPDIITTGTKDSCNQFLRSYWNAVNNLFRMTVQKHICELARTTVDNLIREYESFYMSFESKVPAIERSKEDIVTKLTFRNGDCVRNLLGNRKQLDQLVKKVGMPVDVGDDAAKLYGDIFESIRTNSYIESRRAVNPFVYESSVDIFGDIIIKYYKELVEKTCEVIDVKGVLQGAKLEWDIIASLELEDSPEVNREQSATVLYSDDSTAMHITELIEMCKNLASPVIQRHDNEEPREINLIACNENLSDGGGIRVDAFIPNAIRSASISKYELHFYRAEYNIMPTQLAKFAAPTYNDLTDEFSVGGANEYENLRAGDYFRIYQRYMDRIGPNSKRSAIITPHIDKRWGAISVLPELDMDYQRRLMRMIHKVMLYGFVYERIVLEKASENDDNDKIYKYLNEDNDTVDMIVSNNTKCDKLYEVLDTLYFDRLAVATIRSKVNRIRQKNKDAGFHSHKDMTFFRELDNLRFSSFVSDKAFNGCKDAVSLFTIVLMYCNSLPANSKDNAEMKTMVEAIIEMIFIEMRICTPNEEILTDKVAGLVSEQFELMLKNCEAHKEKLIIGTFSEQVCSAIYRTIRGYFEKNDLDAHARNLTKPEFN